MLIRNHNVTVYDFLWALLLNLQESQKCVHMQPVDSMCYTLPLTDLSTTPKGATSFPDRGSYEYNQIRVSLCLLCLVV